MPVVITRPYVAEFSPLSIPNLALWFDASQITGLSNGQQIPQWNDLGPFGYHLLSSGSGSPQYYTNQRNGLPAVRDVGTSSLIRTQFDPNPPIRSNIIGSNFGTMYTVGYAPNGVNSEFFTLTDLAVSGFEAQIFWGINAINFTFGTGGGRYVQQSPIPGGFLPGWHYQEWYRNGTTPNSAEIWNDGVLGVQSQFSANWTSGNPIRIYFSSATGVMVGEIIVFKRALNPTERQQMRDYLKNKWGF